MKKTKKLYDEVVLAEAEHLEETGEKATVIWFTVSGYQQALEEASAGSMLRDIKILKRYRDMRVQRNLETKANKGKFILGYEGVINEI